MCALCLMPTVAEPWRSRGHARAESKRRQRTARGRSWWLSDVSELNTLDNTVSATELDDLLRNPGVATMPVSPLFESASHGYNRCLIRFSSRFTAMYFTCANAQTWLCWVDDAYLAIRLRRGNTLALQNGVCAELTLPASLSWDQLQAFLVRNFECDGHVRAIAAAVIVSCAPAGEFAGAALELLPAAYQRVVQCDLHYNTPLDDDLMTVLADATLSKGKLHLECGGGYCAQVVDDGTVGTLQRVRKPELSEPFVETATLLMPFLFG